MLRLVYQTEPFKYMVEGEWMGSIWGSEPGISNYPPPYIETFAGTSNETGGIGASWIAGLGSYLAPTPNSPNSVLCVTATQIKYWGYAQMCGYRFDPVTGKLLFRFNTGIYYDFLILQGSSGALYVGYGDGKLYVGQWKDQVTCLLGDRTDKFVGDYSGKAWDLTGATVSPYHFVGPSRMAYPIDENGHYDLEGGVYRLMSFGPYGDSMIDEIHDIFVRGSLNTFAVYKWVSGTWQYDLTLPQEIIAIAQEDPGRCYVLLNNRQLVLIDYLRAEIMGSSKLPPPVGRENGHSTYEQEFTGMDMAWDPVYKRLLVAEIEFDHPDGSCKTCIRGYQMVPEPKRLTLPIPLKVPRQGRIIPVMTQVVGDKNEGVGGHVVSATVSGSGSLIGVPITDHYGRTFLQVACEGNEFYRPNPPDFDYEGTGSPDDPSGPHTGYVDVTVSATVWEPENIPPLGGGLITPENPTGQHPIDDPTIDDGTPGTKSNPIIAMSSDPAQIHRDVEASWNYYDPIGKAHGRDIGSVDYWVGYCDHVGDKFSNGKYYLGWNLYWEVRMGQAAVGDTSGATDPNQGGQPAEHRA